MNNQSYKISFICAASIEGHTCGEQEVCSSSLLALKKHGNQLASDLNQPRCSGTRARAGGSKSR